MRRYHHLKTSLPHYFVRVERSKARVDHPPEVDCWQLNGHHQLFELQLKRCLSIESKRLFWYWYPILRSLPWSPIPSPWHNPRPCRKLSPSLAYQLCYRWALRQCFRHCYPWSAITMSRVPGNYLGHRHRKPENRRWSDGKRLVRGPWIAPAPTCPRCGAGQYFECLRWPHSCAYIWLPVKTCTPQRKCPRQIYLRYSFCQPFCCRPG